MEDEVSISIKLKELRRARGLSVDNLAKKIGENSQKVGRIERGTTGLTLDYLVRVSKALETPLESFLKKDIKNIENEFSSNSNLLSSIVILVEDYCQKTPLNPSKKAIMISKMYELTIKFPKEFQKNVTSALFEFINCLDF